MNVGVVIDSCKGNLARGLQFHASKEEIPHPIIMLASNRPLHVISVKTNHTPNIFLLDPLGVIILGMMCGLEWDNTRHGVPLHQD